MTSRTLAVVRRSGGSKSPSSSSAERASGEPAGCTIADPWKLTVSGGIGATNDNKPPRRTGTVTETFRVAAMCFAFQLRSATATYSRRPTAFR